MHLLEHEPAALGHDPDVLREVPADFLRCALDEHAPGVAPAAPESEVQAELAFEARKLHVRAGELHEVDGVQPRLAYVAQERVHDDDALQAHLNAGTKLLGGVPKGGVARLEDLPVRGEGDLGVGLHVQVVAEANQVQGLPHGAQVLLQVRKVDIGEAVEVGVGAHSIAGELRKDDRGTAGANVDPE